MGSTSKKTPHNSIFPSFQPEMAIAAIFGKLDLTSAAVQPLIAEARAIYSVSDAFRAPLLLHQLNELYHQIAGLPYTPQPLFFEERGLSFQNLADEFIWATADRYRQEAKTQLKELRMLAAAKLLYVHLAIVPQNPITWGRLARQFKLLGERELQRHCLENAAALLIGDNEKWAAAAMQVAKYYYTSKDFGQAIRCYLAILDTYPDMLDTSPIRIVNYVGLYEAYVANHNPDRAQEVLTQIAAFARTLDTNSPESDQDRQARIAAVNLAEIYISRREYQEAESWLMELITIEPPSPSARKRLAQLYVIMGKFDTAKAVAEPLYLTGAEKTNFEEELQQLLAEHHPGVKYSFT